jgi:hypothetical protein
MPYIIITCTITPFIIWWMVAKRKDHGRDCQVARIPHSHLRFYAGSKEAPLTNKERKAYEVLSKVPDRTFTGYCIKRVIQEGSRSGFRQLIHDLYEQQQQAPNGLRLAIGEEAFKVISSFSYSS